MIFFVVLMYIGAFLGLAAFIILLVHLIKKNTKVAELEEKINKLKAQLKKLDDEPTK